MIKKQFLKTKCRVTFELPSALAQDAETVHLVGDFNNWDENATLMERRKGNKFSITLELEPDREYEYRYLINHHIWHNDWEADRYVANPFHSENSVIATYQTDEVAVALTSQRNISSGAIADNLIIDSLF
jgi:1,4-alpha-glucan branching enzyme